MTLVRDKGFLLNLCQRFWLVEHESLRDCALDAAVWRSQSSPLALYRIAFVSFGREISGDGSILTRDGESISKVLGWPAPP